MAKATKQQVAAAQKLLDRLMVLEEEVHGAFYEMGQILYAIYEGRLYDMLGYPSFKALLEEEMSCSSSQAVKYMHTYRYFKTLGYSRAEALDLIDRFSFTHMCKILPKLTKKVGIRAISNAVQKLEKQINFQLSNEDKALLVEILKQFGAVENKGRLENSSEALMALVVWAEGQPKAA
jgi:hypothetical protein